jgi:hypothetical protein
MAQAPMPMSAPPAGGDAGGMVGADPSAGADAGGDMDSGGDDVVVTICANGDGSYTVYPGDEPDAGGGDMGGGSDMGEDDTDAMGAAGDAAAPPGGGGGGAGGEQGQHADSVGAALKIALDIMNSDQSSAGAPGSADDQLASGFSADKSPTPASGPPAKQKY